MITESKIKELIAVKDNVIGRPYNCDIKKIIGKDLDSYVEVIEELLRRAKTHNPFNL